MPHAAEVLILQHPLEVANSKNSARLLHMCLPGSRLVVAESCADDIWLAAAWQAGEAPRRPVLLYPDTAADQAEDLTPPPPMPAGWTEAPGTLRLVVLDATWRKSRKMLYQSPALQRLPRLALKELPTSRYAIRKAHRGHQLSTFESTCAALAQIEPAFQAAIGPLMAAFDGFVAQQAAYRPA
ncbi:MAG: hypothetical protein JWQ88_2839 [Rhodoferax sp.]|nr:hypothetical protein [Rhodoferax sp.]